MELFQFIKLAKAPTDVSTIAVYIAGTLDLATGLVDMNGVPLTNPFTVADAGGQNNWGFEPSDSGLAYDIYWTEEDLYLAKKYIFAPKMSYSETGGIQLPVGTTAERVDGEGMVRLNSDLNAFEGYKGGAWTSLGGVIDVDRDTYITAEETADDDTLRFYTGGVERMVVLSDGKVGIGTTAPSASLHSVGNANNSFPMYLEQQAAGGHGIKIKNTNRSSSADYALQIMGFDNIERTRIDFSGGFYSTSAVSCTDLVLADGNPQITFNETGKLTNSRIYLDSDTLVIDADYGSAASSRIRIKHDGSDVVTINNTNNIGFNLYDLGASAAKVIGIGSGAAPTTSPADAVQLWSADTAGAVGKAGLHIMAEDGTSHVFGDQVGIGTVSPTYQFDVWKSSLFLGSTVGFENTRTYNSNKSVQILFPHYSHPVNDPLALFYASSTIAGSSLSLGGRVGALNGFETLLFYTTTNDGTEGSAIERMRIIADGKVGIGTNAPTRKAHIYGGAIVPSTVLDAQATFTPSTADSALLVGCDSNTGMRGGMVAFSNNGGLVGAGIKYNHGAGSGSISGGMSFYTKPSPTDPLMYESMRLWLGGEVTFYKSADFKGGMTNGRVIIREHNGLGVGSEMLEGVKMVSTTHAHLSSDPAHMIYFKDGFTFKTSADAVNGTTATWVDRFYLPSETKNIGLNTTTFGASADGVLAMASGTAPTTSPLMQYNSGAPTLELSLAKLASISARKMARAMCLGIRLELELLPQRQSSTSMVQSL
jgi:hypothetical protein